MFTFGRIVKWLLPLRGNRSHFSALAPPACGAGALQLPGGGGGGGEEEVKDVEEEEGWRRRRMRMGRWRRISWRRRRGRRGEVEEGEGQGPGDSRRYRRGVKGPNVQRRGRAPPTHARLRPLFLFFFLSLRGESFFT